MLVAVLVLGSVLLGWPWLGIVVAAVCRGRVAVMGERGCESSGPEALGSGALERVLGVPFTCRASCKVCAVQLSLCLCPSIVSTCKALVLVVVTFPFTLRLAFNFILAAVFLLWLQGMSGDVSG